MNKIGITLKKLLHRAQISENELSKRVGVPQQIINRLISGSNQNPKIATVMPIARYFNIPLQDLILGMEETEIEQEIPHKTILIPYIEFPDISTPEIDTAISKSKKFISVDLNDSKKYFATSVHDDSMEPKFSFGTILIFEKSRAPVSGDFCILKSADGEYLFRQILINPQNKQFIKCLNSLDKDYKIVALPQHETTILATLIESRNQFMHGLL